jgi:LmbE family N-acetylglucosaminyl deacetylase
LFAQFDRPRRLAAVHAHPDDETLFTGAALALATEFDFEVRLICLTSGEASELPVPVPEASDSELDLAGRRRLVKLAAACSALGVSDVDAVHSWIDSGGKDHPRAFQYIPPKVLTAIVGEKLAAFDPTVVLTLDADGVTGHIDHIAVASAVREVLADFSPERPITLAAAIPVGIVSAARETMAGLSLGQVGSGGFIGTTAAVTHVVKQGSAGDRKRLAMDRYQPGLGTQNLADLTAAWPRRGNTLLARAVLDELERASLVETYVRI